MNASTKTQSALRAALKQEDASIIERLPVVAPTPGATPAAAAGLDAAAAVLAKAVKAAKAKAAGSKTTPEQPAAKPRAAKVAGKRQPAGTGPAAVVATNTKPASAAKAKAAPKKAAPEKAAPEKAATEKAPVSVATGNVDASAKKVRARLTAAATAEGKKEKREKVVRDSFSMPASEHRRIKSLREELGKAGRLSSKSEVLRAGLHLLGQRSASELVALFDALPAVAKGKRSKKH